MIPRFLYPIMLLTFMSGLAAFWAISILPRMERIYADFGQDMPDITLRLAMVQRSAATYLGGVAVLFLVLAAFAAVVLVSSSFRWNFPILGRLYRRHAQSYVLKMLGVLLNAGMTVPKAVHSLVDFGYFPEAVARRLSNLASLVESGQPLAASMRQSGLLQPAMVPLVEAAERVHNLPWALSELGESLSERTVRALNRISEFAAPVLVMAAGLLVCFVVIGMFMPVIDLVTRLAT